jgi:hypothetical protein
MPVSRKAKSSESVVSFIATASTNLASFLVKEFQRTVSTSAYELLPTTSAKLTTLEALIFKEYHGKVDDTDSKSLVAQFLEGRGPFGNMFERSTTPTGEVVLTLNPLLMPDRTDLPRVGPPTNPNNIHSDVVTTSTLPKRGKSAKKLSGRGIMAQAESVFRNYKLAVLEGQLFLDSNGKLPSGTTKVDYFNFARKRMYHLLKGQQGGADPETDPTDETEPATDYQAEMPEGWMFAGFMAFVLFGPFGEEDDQMNWLKASKSAGTAGYVNFHSNYPIAL